MKAFTFHLTAICLPLLLPAGVLIFAPEHAGAQVAEAWVQRYGNLAGGDDRPTALAVDGSGNVFVTGYSKGANWDFATIKYSPSGVALWTNRFDGGAGSNDQAFDLAIDTDGNAIVTGASIQNGNLAKYTTIKYSTAGVPLWTNWYGAGNKSDGAVALAIDTNGSVYVTGSSFGSNWDYTTIAYSASGQPLWTNRLHETAGVFATVVKSDGNGKVFVTGYKSSVGGSDGYLTVAYDNSGFPLWTNRYGRGVAQALAVGANGNVTVTGTSDTVTYSGGGMPLWTNSYRAGFNYSGTAVAVDGTGNVYVAGYSGSYTGFGNDYVTIAYSVTGTELWAKRYNGPVDGNDAAMAVAVDTIGNVYVTGSSVSENASPGNSDLLTVKYSGTGDTLWVARYNGPANGYDAPPTKSIALSPDGAVYVLGASVEIRLVPTCCDYVIIKYVSAPIQPTHLGITKNSNWVILEWTNEAYSLQSAPAPTGPFTNMANATSPFPSPISGIQQFYWLKSN